MELTGACIAQKSLEGGGTLKAAFAFLASASYRRHEGLVLWWFGEFVTLGRKPCSFPKDIQELSGNARLV